jgi:hypothetical protein
VLAERLRALNVITWAPDPRDRWFAILGDQITGRRIPMTVTPADLGWFAFLVS